MTMPPSGSTAQPSGSAEPSSSPVLRRVLRYTAVLTLVIAVAAAAIGYLVAGGNGLLSGLLGAAMTLVFLGITAASIVFANRFAGSDLFVPAFFGIVLGGWVLKFIVFLVLVFLLKDQPFVDTTVLFLTVVVSVLGSLAVDVLVVARSRMPYVSDSRLPKAPEQ